MMTRLAPYYHIPYTGELLYFFSILKEENTNKARASVNFQELTHISRH